MAPSSKAENTTSPFFIRIKDVPQMLARISSSTQADVGVRWGGGGATAGEVGAVATAGVGAVGMGEKIDKM
ncbi:hypothetical protein GCM10011378_20540 [Hymenobacter glacieicola]|uniref:Uncharacterized protein n=1 Tax=Hymenobacter glacieicola TaxID=1562124 RepID=A0ABQ1WSZ6_9BACT|nr:hypothetical protein GCM10011378_20540 [Hymenobacter glacieicola]